ncbi:MAG: RNA polymerase sigma factor [Anaerolineae bacterium]|nr:RNA polymerase sigma factor [Anaerolineae bacterium]
MNIDSLIVRWQADDERAAEALYNAHRDRTFRLAYGLLGDPAEAEEAAQDALNYALTNIDRYEPQRASFSMWLYTITVSRCRDRQRRRRLSWTSLTPWLARGGQVADPTPDQERLLIQTEMRSEVWEAVQNLSPCLREAIVLRHWGEHTYQEMAEIMGCPLPTAQSRVRLAYERLRAVLAANCLAELSDAEEGIVR